MGRRAARMAGKRPPKKPMHDSDDEPGEEQGGGDVEGEGDLAEASANSSSRCESRRSRSKPGRRRRCRRPAARSEGFDQHGNHDRAARRNPRARRVAISRVRAATAVYMVLSAPNTAPMAIRTGDQAAQPVMSLVDQRDCSA